MVARGGKTRLIGFICMVLVFSAVLYVFHETQVELDGVRHSASSCTHQLESISSQLQVIVEHKLKLERSLAEEKHEHLKTKEDLNAAIQDEKQLRDKQNVDSMNRYNEIERNHEVLQEEEKNLREELEKLKLKYLKEEKKNKQLTQELNDAQNRIQNFKNEKMKSESEKENLENNQNNNLQKSSEFSNIKFIQKTNDIMNVTKLKSGSVTPAINPQAIDGATAKSSTPMISSKVIFTNKSLPTENDEANPINQPIIMDISSDKVPNNVLVSQNETSSTQESQVGGNESMKAMPAPPQEETVRKDTLNNNEEEKLSKQKNNSYKYEYEQEHFKEDEDDEDMNDFDTREDGHQHANK
ncbi:Golgi integral membrane protein 4-like isoform X2 [Rhopalosiphum padi]|uniref:Golgi integral membrane protein 4-like isoform X2 n=1 Tax=Rhopalosiphum padi TaxID=40932 RepID=UPI00298E459A|nr:Golgi integral membrane protein 4-like isoform X2 [Rhopalosiphum padi]XP_060833698.1 Golgi integral membrane protein 4-like isoform X2 [Rhopalosiphum padi]